MASKAQRFALPFLAFVTGCGVAMAAGDTFGDGRTECRAQPGEVPVMVSPLGRFRAYMKNDGNFIIYKAPQGKNLPKEVWESGTNQDTYCGNRIGHGQYLVLFPDGTFAVMLPKGIPHLLTLSQPGCVAVLGDDGSIKLMKNGVAISAITPD